MKTKVKIKINDAVELREHAMVASDYAVKVINLKFPADMEAVKSERERQIRAMKR